MCRCSVCGVRHYQRRDTVAESGPTGNDFTVSDTILRHFSVVYFPLLLGFEFSCRVECKFVRVSRTAATFVKIKGLNFKRLFVAPLLGVSNADVDSDLRLFGDCEASTRIMYFTI